MKRNISFFFLFVISIFFVGCDKDYQDNANESSFTSTIRQSIPIRNDEPLTAQGQLFYDDISSKIANSELTSLDADFKMEWGNPLFDALIISKSPFGSFYTHVPIYNSITASVTSFFRVVEHSNGNLLFKFKARGPVEDLMNIDPDREDEIKYDKEIFDWIDYMIYVTNVFPFEPDVAESSSLDCHRYVAGSTCSGFINGAAANHTYDDASCRASIKGTQGSWVYDESMCNSINASDDNPFSWTNPSSGSGGNGWGTSSTKALFWHWYNLTSKWMDGNTKLKMNQILNQINGKGKDDCVALLQILYAMVKQANSSDAAILTANCMANSMDFESGECYSNFADPNDVLANINPDLLAWSVDNFDLSCSSVVLGEPFKNPLCDLISQGYSAEDINVILGNLKNIVDGIDHNGLELEGGGGEACSLDVCEANEIVDAIMENSGAVDPCNPSANVIVSALSNLSLNGGCGVDDFLEELKGMTFTDYSSLKESCPKYYCIMQNFSSGDDNWFCQIIQGISGSDKFEYLFDFVDGTRITTSYENREDITTKNTVTMNIPSSFCGESSQLTDLELASKFIHEILHAQMFGWIFDDDENGIVPDLNFLQTSEYWAQMVEAKFGPPVPPSNYHHPLFLTEYKDKIMEALWTLNGMQGDIGDYEYFAHILINTQDMADDINDPDKIAKYPWLLELGLDDFDLESLSTKWTENIVNIYGFNLDCIEN